MTSVLPEPMSMRKGATAVYRGGIPASLDEAGGHNNPSDLPYAITNPPIAAGSCSVIPYTTGQSEQDPVVVGVPRNNATLSIAMHPLDAA